jgi:predicted  nucleic acid-binding Zn-ribbon protein
MLSFQDEEISNGERRIREWQSKFVGLQSRLDRTMGDISEQFEDMLQRLDEMRIRVEELKVPGTDRFEKLRGEIVEINDRIEKDYLEIERKLYS